MGILNREQIKNADDIKTERVKVPEWGECAEVIVKAMTGEERDDLEALMAERRKGGKVDFKGLKVSVVIHTCVDESGNRIFQNGDVDWLNQKSSCPLDRIFQAAAKLSHILPDSIEEMLGNSETDPNA